MTDLEKILYTLRESRKVIKQNTNINTSIKITLQQIENSIYLVKNLSLSGVSKSFTIKEIVNELEDSDHLDDAIMFFKESE